MSEYVFRSDFAPYMESLIELKRKMNISVRKYEQALKGIDIFFFSEAVNVPSLNRDIVMKWREECIFNKEITKYVKYGVLVQLCKHINNLGVPCYIPKMPKAGFDSYVPYIFSTEEIQRIFIAADGMVLAANNLKQKVFPIPAILRILYATGARVSEITSLCCKDVDLQKGIIVLNKTKNNQQRMLPLNSSVIGVLSQYKAYRSRVPAIKSGDKEDSPFFISPLGTGLDKKAVYNWFRMVLERAGIEHKGRMYGPRLHDLRHTFAVHTLEKQLSAGHDIYTVLPVLSTYLGHKSIFSTEKYVRLTEENYPKVMSAIGTTDQIFENLANNFNGNDYEEE